MHAHQLHCPWSWLQRQAASATGEGCSQAAAALLGTPGDMLTWLMMSGVTPAFPLSLGMPSASIIRVKVQMSCRSTNPCTHGKGRCCSHVSLGKRY